MTVPPPPGFECHELSAVPGIQHVPATAGGCYCCGWSGLGEENEETPSLSSCMRSEPQREQCPDSLRNSREEMGSKALLLPILAPCV